MNKYLFILLILVLLLIYFIPIGTNRNHISNFFEKRVSSVEALAPVQISNSNTNDSDNAQEIYTSINSDFQAINSDFQAINSDFQAISDNNNRTNFMFVKTHKCGTSTLVNVFYLYGARNKLNFVLNPYQHNIYLNMKLLPPRPGGQYNIQCQHGTFHPWSEHRILPKANTFYSTIVRSPVSHFQSAFNFFGGSRQMKKKYGTEKTLDELINKYLDQFPPNNNRAYLNNFMNSAARDLGYEAFSRALPASLSLQEKIVAFISHLDREMDFVMITDRMDESLVLLKHYLGWRISDILYLKRMVSSKKKEELSNKTRTRILEYQVIDRELFGHFNETFEQHIKTIGEQRFENMVIEFQNLRNQFEDKCFDKTVVVKGAYKSLSWKISDYGKYENLACTFLQTRDIILSNVMTELQISNDYEDTSRCRERHCLMQSNVQSILSQSDYEKV